MHINTVLSKTGRKQVVFQICVFPFNVINDLLVSEMIVKIDNYADTFPVLVFVKRALIFRMVSAPTQ